jgi:PPOX class probable F420-dependent enzyme
MLDFSSDFGAKALARLKNEEGIWLTTVTPDGRPQPNPVWFLWEGDSFLIFTQPGSHKVRNLRHNPQVSLNFDARLYYEDLVVFVGEVEMGVEVSEESQAAYLKKYRADIERLDMTPETFFHSYSLPLRLRPAKMRGW